MTTRAPHPPMPLIGLQGLRFVAASLVVAMHASLYMAQRTQGASATDYWHAGGFGVHIFFVISGFVMGMSSPVTGRWGAVNMAAAKTFLLRRLIRVVPMYWLYTLAKLAVLLLLPTLALRSHLDPAHLLASFAFWPHRDSAGIFFPLLQVGWTLNFEMLFYAVYAAALALGAPALVWTLLCYAGLLGLAALGGPDSAWAFWAQSIFLEFALGLVLATPRSPWARLRPPVAFVVCALGWGLWAWSPLPPGWPGVLVSGLPAALIVAGTLGLEPWFQHARVAAWLTRGGDISYAIYLGHTFVVPLVVAALVKVGWPSAALAAVLSLLLVPLIADPIYRWIERPCTRYLKARLAP